MNSPNFKLNIQNHFVISCRDCIPTGTKKLVITLVNGEQKKAGYYEAQFDGTNFASGVYFYRIEADKFVQSKKMVLVK
ncbi:MAG: T9SS type A sorting domain-containing protein [Ignavibacteria bacterium]